MTLKKLSKKAYIHYPTGKNRHLKVLVRTALVTPCSCGAEWKLVDNVLTIDHFVKTKTQAWKCHKNYFIVNGKKEV